MSGLPWFLDVPANADVEDGTLARLAQGHADPPE
jgi:hypothetical protein